MKPRIILRKQKHSPLGYVGYLLKGDIPEGYTVWLKQTYATIYRNGDYRLHVGN